MGRAPGRGRASTRSCRVILPANVAVLVPRDAAGGPRCREPRTLMRVPDIAACAVRLKLLAPVRGTLSPVLDKTRPVTTTSRPWALPRSTAPLQRRRIASQEVSANIGINGQHIPHRCEFEVVVTLLRRRDGHSQRAALFSLFAMAVSFGQDQHHCSAARFLNGRLGNAMARENIIGSWREWWRGKRLFPAFYRGRLWKLGVPYLQGAPMGVRKIAAEVGLLVAGWRDRACWCLSDGSSTPLSKIAP